MYFDFDVDSQTIGGGALLLWYSNPSIEENIVFLSIANMMLITSAVLDFSRALHGITNWIRIGPELRSIPLPPSEPKTFWTSPIMRMSWDFDHIALLSYYTDQVTSIKDHAVCKDDTGCDLKPLPGTLSYSLTKLEQKAEDFVTLGGWQYFLKKVCEPVWNVVQVYAVIGGCITATQWLYWTISWEIWITGRRFNPLPCKGRAEYVITRARQNQRMTGFFSSSETCLIEMAMMRILSSMTTVNEKESGVDVNQWGFTIVNTQYSSMLPSNIWL